MSVVQRIAEHVTWSRMLAILTEQYVSMAVDLALFICILLLLRVFVKHSFLTARIIVCWALASLTTMAYLTNEKDDLVAVALNSQVLLTMCSLAALLLFYIFGMVFKKPRKRTKAYGRNSWWVGILGFAVTFAFCCMFNIMLYVSCVIFYL